MIRAIIGLGINKYGKFKEIGIDAKSALVFRLNVPGSRKTLVSEHKLKWGMKTLSTRTIAGIGALSVVGAAVVGAGAHYFLNDP